jgi:hypothetical protein
VINKILSHTSNKGFLENLPRFSDWSLAVKLVWTKPRSSELSVLAVCTDNLLMAFSQVGILGVQFTSNCSCNITTYLENYRDLLCPIHTRILKNIGSDSSNEKLKLKLLTAMLSIEVKCFHKQQMI